MDSKNDEGIDLLLRLYKCWVDNHGKALTDLIFNMTETTDLRLPQVVGLSFQQAHL